MNSNSRRSSNPSLDPPHRAAALSRISASRQNWMGSPKPLDRLKNSPFLHSAPAIERDLGPGREVPVEGPRCGIDEFLRNVIGVDPADLGVLAGFAVFGFAGPFVGGEHDRKEAVGGLDAPGTVDDVGDLKGL